jgi:predicted dehydrogenase
MPLKVGLLGVGHVHAPSYVHCLNESAGVEYLGHWDKDATLRASFAGQTGSKENADRDALIAASDAVVVAGENLDHADLIEAAVAHGKPVLCEKPLAANDEQRERIAKAGTKALVMTAFPCPFAPAFESAMAKIEAGDIGKILSVCATNHGKCPGGWFTDVAKSGGGAMADHVAHVADLLRRLTGEEPQRVYAVTGNNMYGEGWEDTAMLSIEFPSGVFATLDSSWSRPKSFKTWGDVTLKILGEKGGIELDLFVQALDWFGDASGAHGLLGFGSNLDQAMVGEFLSAVRGHGQPRVTLADGLAASDLVLAAYQSAKSGQPVSVGQTTSTLPR